MLRVILGYGQNKQKHIIYSRHRGVTFHATQFNTDAASSMSFQMTNGFVRQTAAVLICHDDH